MDDIIDNLVVVKRSGQRVIFNGVKIAVAIKKAFDCVDQVYSKSEINKIYEDTLSYIRENYKTRKTITIEDIQDIIEKSLNNKKYKPVYEEFSSYRKRRTESRKAFSAKQQHKLVKAIEKINYMETDNMTPNELLHNFSKTISSEYATSYTVDNKYVKAHEEGKLYLHELSYFDLGYLGPTNLMVKNYIKDNCFQEIVYLLLSSKKEISGEIKINNIDQLLNDYILKKYKENLYIKVKNYLELCNYLEFIDIYKLQTEISILDSIYVDKSLENVFLNKKTRELFNKACNDTLTEINTFLKVNLSKLLEVLDKEKNYSISLGSGIKKESILVQNVILEILKENNYRNICVIYKINKHTNIEELASVILNKNNIRLDFTENDYYFSNGLKINNGEGKSNIANISIDLTRLVLEHEADFYNKLDDLFDLSINGLEFIFETIGDKKKENYKILFNKNIYDDEKLEANQKIRKVIKSGTLNINLIGLKECALVLDNENYHKIILKILKYLNKKIELLNESSKLIFTMSSINYKEASEYLIDIDKTAFGLIDNITKKDIYENISYVSESEIENVASYQKLLTGGNTLELKLSKKAKTNKIVELINKIQENKILYANLLVEDI